MNKPQHRISRVLVSKLLLVLLLCSTVGSTRAATELSPQQKLEAVIAKIKKEQMDPGRGPRSASDIDWVTSKINRDRVDDGGIADLASLLDSPYTIVRYYTAKALGRFGSRAKFAIPKIELLLAAVPNCQNGLTIELAYEEALRKIGANNIRPDSCIEELRKERDAHKNGQVGTKSRITQLVPGHPELGSRLASD